MSRLNKKGAGANIVDNKQSAYASKGVHLGVLHLVKSLRIDAMES